MIAYFFTDKFQSDLLEFGHYPQHEDVILENMHTVGIVVRTSKNCNFNSGLCIHRCMQTLMRRKLATDDIRNIPLNPLSFSTNLIQITCALYFETATYSFSVHFCDAFFAAFQKSSPLGT